MQSALGHREKSNDTNFGGFLSSAFAETASEDSHKFRFFSDRSCILDRVQMAQCMYQKCDWTLEGQRHEN